MSDYTMQYPTSVYESLFAAQEQERTKEATTTSAQTSPPERCSWGLLESDSLHWEHTLFGILDIKVQSHTLTGCDSSSTEANASFWAEIVLGSQRHPEILGFCLKTKTLPGVTVLRAQAGVVTDCTGNTGVFSVPVDWLSLDNGGRVPHTRTKDQDNIELIFLSQDGSFLQLQVSITTRNQKFWLAAQEVYAGQVVRTTHLRAKKFPLLRTRWDRMLDWWFRCIRRMHFLEPTT